MTWTTLEIDELWVEFGGGGGLLVVVVGGGGGGGGLVVDLGNRKGVRVFWEMVDFGGGGGGGGVTSIRCKFKTKNGTRVETRNIYIYILPCVT